MFCEAYIKIKCFFGFHYYKRFINSIRRLEEINSAYPVHINCTHRECIFCGKLQKVDGYWVEYGSGQGALFSNCKPEDLEYE